MTTLDFYLKKWRLSDPVLIADTRTSAVYAVVYEHREKAVLKLLTEIGISDERAGALALNVLDGRGTVKIFEHTNDAHLLEHVDGRSLEQCLLQNQSDELATTILIDVFRAIQEADYKSEEAQNLPTLESRFRSLLGDLERFRSLHCFSLLKKAKAVAKKLLEQVSSKRILHGDLHHGNILESSQRGWIAIDPKGLYGDPLYDLANLFLNPMPMPRIANDEGRFHNRLELVRSLLNVDASLMTEWIFAHACLSACWSIDDGDDCAHALQIARIAESII